MHDKDWIVGRHGRPSLSNGVDHASENHIGNYDIIAMDGQMKSVVVTKYRSGNCLRSIGTQ